MFKVGPFSKYEIEIGRPQSRVWGSSGEYDGYRIVTAQRSQGRIRQLWAMLQFELFRLRRIRWRSENVQELPLRVREMLER